MNLIFHDLLGVILEVYIDDIVNKSASLDHLQEMRPSVTNMSLSLVIEGSSLKTFCDNFCHI